MYGVCQQNDWILVFVQKLFVFVFRSFGMFTAAHLAEKTKEMLILHHDSMGLEKKF
jgi:hypothetical protein